MSATPFHRLHAAQLQATHKLAKVYERKPSRTTITDCFGMFWITGMSSASSAESCRISLCWKRLQFQKASARKAWRHIERWQFDKTGEIGWNPVKSTRKKHWTRVLRSREASAQKTIPLSSNAHNLQVFRNIGRTVGPVAYRSIRLKQKLSVHDIEEHSETPKVDSPGRCESTQWHFSQRFKAHELHKFSMTLTVFMWPVFSLMSWPIGICQDSPLQTCWGTHHIDQSTPDVSTHKRNAPSWPIPRWPTVTHGDHVAVGWHETGHHGPSTREMLPQAPSNPTSRRRSCLVNNFLLIFFASLQSLQSLQNLQSMSAGICWITGKNVKTCKTNLPFTVYSFICIKGQLFCV